MLLKDTIHMALRGVNSNPSRSLLTMLGIIIGVCSVVLMTSIGASVQGLILSQVNSIGTDTIIVIPGKLQGIAAQTDTLTFEDADAIERLNTVAKVSKAIAVSGNVVYGREEEAPELNGVDEEFFEMQSIEAGVGRLIDAADVKAASSVVVLGSDTATNLFGNQDPIGKRVRIGNQTFSVIGMTKRMGSRGFGSMDKQGYIPVTTAQIMTGRKHVTALMVQAAGDVELAIQDMTALLRQRHRIKNPENDADKDDFSIQSAAQALEILETVTFSLTIFLAAIAAISLIVGGIGIMNIML